jgi:uncharacterized membrane protein HdeD (DUF308 family)
MEQKPRPWWLTLVGGILAVITGAILLWSPAKTKVDTYLILIAILGLYWLVEGFLDIISIFTDHTAWGWKLFIGIIGILAGAYILMYPVASALALPRTFVLVLGIWGLIQGIVLLILAFRGGGWGAGIAGVLGIIFGGILMANYASPGTGLAFLWTAAIAALVIGAAMIFMAFRQRSA